MSYTLARAAQATGLNRSTILRAIKSGRISGTRDELGQWSVEPVELHRVFPPAEATPRPLPQHAQPDAELRLRAAMAEERLAELRGLLEDMRSQRDDMKADRDHWREQAQAATRQLTDQRKPELAMTWWRWLRTPAA